VGRVAFHARYGNPTTHLETSSSAAGIRPSGAEFCRGLSRAASKTSQRLSQRHGLPARSVPWRLLSRDLPLDMFKYEHWRHLQAKLGHAPATCGRRHGHTLAPLRHSQLAPCSFQYTSSTPPGFTLKSNLTKSQYAISVRLKLKITLAD
jgi:hypothetical protein